MAARGVGAPVVSPRGPAGAVASAAMDTPWRARAERSRADLPAGMLSVMRGPAWGTALLVALASGYGCGDSDDLPPPADGRAGNDDCTTPRSQDKHGRGDAR